MIGRPILLGVFLQERGWESWPVFSLHFNRTAVELARETGVAQLARVTVPRSTFQRWLAGGSRPRRDAAMILERLLGYPCDALFSSAPGPVAVGSRAMGTVLEQTWPTSRLWTSGADTGVWELSGRLAWDGTTAAVAFQSATAEGQLVELGEAGVLESFLRPVRRGFVVGSDQEAGRLFLADASAHRAPGGARGGAALRVPEAYELDDLTYGLVWSVVQLDDALLADDRTLYEAEPTFEAHLGIPRSAPSRLGLEELSAAGRQWAGSAFCARYIQRQIEGESGLPVFWTREQSGEECAPWLVFRHKIDYLASLSARFAGAGAPLCRVFCLPEASVSACPRYERILLFLTLALMELHGVRVQVVTEPMYAAVDGFVLVPGERAVVATWVRTDAVWQAYTTSERAAVRQLEEPFRHAVRDGIIEGADPAGRLRAAADYLALDWSWLLQRCEALGEAGVGGVVRPRSRLLTLSALDRVLRYVGSLSRAAVLS
ncbi:transcriptional regulator, XRE family protein [Streptomyces sp. NPDC000594]|uniref:transcriptional regulator, XRE family protein n=1 Tax=Streptomyces sp. NPDC000594 TaxID=3154261 RepID=UPI00331D93CE